MIVLAVMYLIRGYFPSAQLTVPLCCSSGVHTASGQCSPLAYSQLLATRAHLQGSQSFKNKTNLSLSLLLGFKLGDYTCSLSISLLLSDIQKGNNLLKFLQWFFVQLTFLSFPK